MIQAQHLIHPEFVPRDRAFAAVARELNRSISSVRNMARTVFDREPRTGPWSAAEVEQHLVVAERQADAVANNQASPADRANEALVAAKTVSRSQVRETVFAELGEGMVDFPAILDPLLAAGFDGWLIVETDITLKPTAFESAQISRQYLRSIGL